MIDSPTGSDELSPLKQALVTIQELRAKLSALEHARSEPIAIVGMACRFPGASNPQELWQLLSEGRATTGEVPSSRWDVNACYDADVKALGKMYTRYGGFLDQIDEFDPEFFGITPREAHQMDPQQRLLLEVAWEALEGAGLLSNQLFGSQTGVYVAIGTDEYGRMLHSSLSHLDAYSWSGGADCFAAGRLGYLIDLHGPNVSLDTACSASLVAVHQACRALRARECTMAIAGGVNLIVTPDTTIDMCKIQVLSRGPFCRTFDAAADGYVRAEGCGVVVLKRLTDAVAERDSILAVIRGTAINHNGRSNGITAPNRSSQEAVLREALDDARLRPGDVSYLEAHGTGEPLGDPIEVRAATTVLASDRPADKPLYMGSIKTNIGHTEFAAGLAGLIKTVLMLGHRQIPAHLHLETLNPLLSLDGVPVVIPRTLTEWPGHGGTRVAGVSSFGASGTNAHVVVAEAPERRPPVEPLMTDRPASVLALSARTETALQELALRFARRLESDPPESLADFCFSVNTGRPHWSRRLAVVGMTPSVLKDRLDTFLAGDPQARVAHAESVQPEPRVVFLMTGQGSQYAGMGRGLFAVEPVFRQAMEQCEDLLRSSLERPLLSVIYGDDDEQLDETMYTQPALFAIEYALAKLWESWGIRAAAIVGHSIGEYVGACLAGIFSLQEGLGLAAERGRLMQNLPNNGSMAAVFAEEQRVAAAIADNPQLSIATINAERNIVVSGDSGALERVLAELKESGVSSRRLTVSHAFHSHLMEPMLTDFQSAASAVRFSPAQIPVVSSHTGTLAPAGLMQQADYWARQTRGTVRFNDALRTLRELDYSVLLEIGPGTTLTALGKSEAPEATWLASLRRGREDHEYMLDSLAELYVRGAPVDWSSFDAPFARKRIGVPTYPFQRRRFWIDAPAPSHDAFGGESEGLGPPAGVATS